MHHADIARTGAFVFATVRSRIANPRGCRMNFDFRKMQSHLHAHMYGLENAYLPFGKYKLCLPERVPLPELQLLTVSQYVRARAFM